MRQLPNIILITADSLRADHCSFLRGKEHLTPFLDKIASEGLIFENAYSNGPMTAISLPAIMTGTLPIFKMSTKIGTRITIPELLRRLGYISLGYISSNDFAKVFSGSTENKFTFVKSLGMPWYTSRKRKLVRYLLSLINSSLRKDSKSLREFVNWLTIFVYGVIKMPWDFLRSYFITAIAKLLLGRPPEAIPILLDYNVTKLATSSLKAILSINSRRPFFLWLHYMSTHMPYKFTSEDLWESCIRNLKEGPLVKRVLKRQKANSKEIRKIREYYKLGVKEFDKNLQRLFEGLEEVGALDNTVIVVTSDHGEEFFEHGEYGHPPWKLYDVNLRVPLVIWGTENKGWVKELVSSVDIFPTLLDLPGIRERALTRAMAKILEGRSIFSDEPKTIISEGIQGKGKERNVFVNVLLGKTSRIILPGNKVIIRATNEEGHCIIENVVGTKEIKVIECTNENLIEACKRRLNEILGKSKRDERLELSTEVIRAAYNLKHAEGLR